MLKKRSKTVSTKQGVVSHNSLTPTTGNLTHRPTSSFPFPLAFSGFSPKVFSDSKVAVITPNSTLDFKPFFSIWNLLFSNRKPNTCCLNKASGINHYPWGGKDSKPIGLAIAYAISNKKADEKSSLAENRILLLGSQLKVQIPSSINQISSYRTRPVESTCPPIEFGVKNKNSQLAMALVSTGRRSPLASTIPSMENHPRALCLSASEIELSEDYTCVISHRPQQKTTHIFDNFIIEGCSNGFSSFREIRLSADQFGGYNTDYFLTSCHTCRIKIAHGNDICIVRGDETFCSQECRNQEIICQQGRDKSGGSSASITF